MSTHGVVIIRVGGWVWGFHVTHDGQDVQRVFYRDNKHLDDAKKILENALDEFTDEGYSDCPSVNIYKEKFDPHKHYADVTEYTCYFDGARWHTNFVDDELGGDGLNV